MGYREDEESPSTPRQLAERLHAALSAQGAVMRRADMRAWEADMRRLVGEAGLERVQAALLWYCLHRRDPFVPDARSASAFREKFERIEAAVERWRRDQSRPAVRPGAPPAPVTAADLDDDGRWVLDELLRLGDWPFDTRAQLPAVVRDTLEACRALWRAVRPLALAADAKDRERRGRLSRAEEFAQEFVAYGGQGADGMCLRYLEGLHSRVRRWTYPGRLRPMLLGDAMMCAYIAEAVRDMTYAHEDAADVLLRGAGLGGQG